MRDFHSERRIIALEDLKPHPRNPNTHSTNQIERLELLIRKLGFRVPIIVSNLTGYIVAGHGRLQAAQNLKLKEVPVEFQDFNDADEEYQFLVSDNAISEWSSLDLGDINAALADFGPDFDIDLLGIEDFKLDAFEKQNLDDKQKKDQESKHILEVQFTNETDMMEVYEDLLNRGFLVKVK